jgi:hypothetical protein
MSTCVCVCVCVWGEAGVASLHASGKILHSYSPHPVPLFRAAFLGTETDRVQLSSKLVYVRECISPDFKVADDPA